MRRRADFEILTEVAARLLAETPARDALALLRGRERLEMATEPGSAAGGIRTVYVTVPRPWQAEEKVS